MSLMLNRFTITRIEKALQEAGVDGEIAGLINFHFTQTQKKIV
jgi:hypothetical protein